MGYFSNGSEGSSYEAKFCDKCVHRDGPNGKSGCPVMLSHILFAYKLCNEKEDEGKQILDILIPRDGPWNEQCAMFHEGPAVVAEGCLDGRKPEDPTPIMPAMREWAQKRGLIVK